MDRLDELLTYLERTIDTDHLDHVTNVLSDQLDYKPLDTIPLRVAYPLEEFPPYTMAETHEDMGKMMYNELRACVVQLESKDYSLPMIRTNYGVGTLPSLFGLHSRLVNNNMPWVDHLESEEQVRELISKGVPDLDAGFGKQVSLTHEFYREKLSHYPKCSQYIHVFHPDLQGPFDIAHLVYGPDIYTAVYDDDELIHSLMDLCTETYIKFMERIKTEINDEIDGKCYHWGALYGGKVVLRDDSPVNLSLDMYKEFAKQYDDRILDHFGTGSMHFCGRADQWIFEMAATPNLLSLNFGWMEKLVFGQEYLDFIMPELSKNKKSIISYTLTEKELETFDFEKYNTGINFAVNFPTKEKALAALKKYR